MNGMVKKTVSFLLFSIIVLSILAPAAAAQETGTRLLGDVNLDSRITLKDASIVQRAVVKLENLNDEQNKLADVDGTPGVTLKDAYIIQRYVLSIKADYPKNAQGLSIGDHIEFTSDSDTEADTSTDQTDTTVTETDTSNDQTDTAVTETDTSTDQTDTAVTETDTSTDQTDTAVTETDTSTDQTDTAVTETDTSTDQTDTTVTETDTNYDETDSGVPVIEYPLEQINAELNGDFENGDTLPTGWVKFWNYMDASSAKGAGVNGSTALRFNHSTEKMSFVVHRVNGLKPGADYKFRVKVKADSVELKPSNNGLAVDVGTCLNGMYLTAKHPDGSLDWGKGYMMYTTENWLSGSFDWKEITCYFIADSQGHADIVCYLHGIGTAYYDDMVIETADFDNEVTEVERFTGRHVGIIVYREDIEGLDRNEISAWVEDLDYCYDQLAELMGGVPYYGDMQYYVSSSEPQVLGYAALGAINPIKWNRGYMKSACIERCTQNMKTRTAYHEMGHNFDMMYPWEFDPEATADYKAAFVLSQLKDALVDPRGASKLYPVEEYINYIKNGGGDSYEQVIVGRKGTTPRNAMGYVLYRMCETAGWDVTEATFRKFSEDYDISFNTSAAKLNYWVYNLQMTYNEMHPEAKGTEVLDSFPEGEFEYIRSLYASPQDLPEHNFYKVQYVTPDGDLIWTELVLHGHAATLRAVSDHEKYGAFNGWDRDLSSVTCDMVVTANYENYKSAGTVTASSDKVYEGEYIDFTVQPDGEHSYVYNIIVMKDDTKVFESGYTQNTSAKVYIAGAGQYAVYAQLKDTDGNEYSTSKLYFSAGRAVTIYYSGFNNPNIHYKSEDNPWTAVPGLKMAANSDVSGYSYKYVIPIISEGSSAEMCFNDGGSNWDNNGEKNYKVSEGVYGIKNGTVTKITG